MRNETSRNFGTRLSRLVALSLLAVAFVGTSTALRAAEIDKSALEKAKKHIEAGAELYGKKRFEKAVSEFEAALRFVPHHPYALYNIGVCYSRMGKNAEAKAAYQRLLAAHPDHADGLTNLGEIFDSEDDTKTAEEYYRKAIAADPKFGRAHHNLAVLLDRTGKADEALETYKTHLKIEETKPLEQREPYAYYSLGVAYLERGDTKAAKDLLLKAHSIDTDSVYINNALGNVYIIEKNAGLALSHFQAALKADPAYPPVHEGLGDVYRLQGDNAKALGAYKKALELRPDYASVHFKLGDLAAKSSPKEAISHFQNYLKYGKNPAEKERVTKLIEDLKRRL
jgi:tetratricopeptide (TPR) repeat protein